MIDKTNWDDDMLALDARIATMGPLEGWGESLEIINAPRGMKPKVTAFRLGHYGVCIQCTRYVTWRCRELCRKCHNEKKKVAA